MLLQKEDHEQRQIRFASPDAHKEHSIELTPVEKERVFRNGITAMNKVGWVFWNETFRVDQIVMSKDALRRVEPLIELNPHVCAADLVSIMEQCMELFKNAPMPGYPDENDNIACS